MSVLAGKTSTCPPGFSLLQFYRREKVLQCVLLERSPVASRGDAGQERLSAIGMGRQKCRRNTARFRCVFPVNRSRRYVAGLYTRRSRFVVPPIHVPWSIRTLAIVPVVPPSYPLSLAVPEIRSPVVSALVVSAPIILVVTAIAVVIAAKSNVASVVVGIAHTPCQARSH